MLPSLRPSPPFTPLPMRRLVLLTTLPFLPGLASAETLGVAVIADTYINDSTSAANYGTLGALQITGPGNAKGEMQGFLRFDLAQTLADFDNLFGPRAWTLTAATLSLFTGTGTDGEQPRNARFAPINDGLFEIRWLSNDTWDENTLTQNNAIDTVFAPATTSASLGTFLFPADGDGTDPYALTLAAPLVNDLLTGDLLTLYLLAADPNVSYLFDSRANRLSIERPRLLLTAAAIPEPGTLGLLAGATALGLAGIRRRRPRGEA